MSPTDHHSDLKLAQETCNELRAGNTDAILVIYNQYQPFFLSYAQKRVRSFDKDRALSILDDFWVELLNAKAICDFQGFASLKSYLFRILNHRIIDDSRRADRIGSYSKNISDKEHHLNGFIAEDESPEEDLMEKEKIKIIHEALLMLSESHARDAYYVRLHLEGLDYRQMAEAVLAEKSPSEKELEKKVNSIKKQFTREKSGSLARFKACLEKVMRKNNLVHDDILN